MPRSLRDLGVPERELPAVTDAAFAWANDSGNPRDITRAELEALLRRACRPQKEEP
jgi:alcohol dehydrogenase class IV